MKKDLLKLKGESAIICYIEMLQNNIARMSNYSGIIKASTGVVYTVFVSLIISIEKLQQYWWIAIVITIYLAVLDAYYLALEKTFIDKYNSFINNLNLHIVDVNGIYDMKPRTTTLKCEILARTFESLKSFSVIGFYSIFIILSLIINFI